LPALERDVGPPYHFAEALKQFGPNEINRPLPWRELTEEQQAFQSVKMAIHAAMIYRLDREVGRIVQQLRVMGVLDNTLILVMSDNGASAEIMVRDDGHDPKATPGSAATHLCLGPGWSSTANTPLRRHKTWVHEGGISTPLIAHWPKGISARGELRHNPGHLIDIVPTILELVGGKAPTKWKEQTVPPPPGKSLVSVFTKDNSISHDYLWWCHEGNRAVRVGDWKLVAAGAKGPWELYDLKIDRGESHNLTDKLPEKAHELETIWTQHYRGFCELALKDAPGAPPKKAK
jgi:arylsulfatase